MSESEVESEELDEYLKKNRDKVEKEFLAKEDIVLNKTEPIVRKKRVKIEEHSDESSIEGESSIEEDTS